jgi:hypothetical protein
MMSTTVMKNNFDLDKGKCKKCGFKIPGIWS